MPLYNINEIRSRFLRRKPVNQRRLEATNLELDVPLEHVEEETLPLEMHETLGVGYAFDRLMYIDLNDDNPVPRPLPGRHELIKRSSRSPTNNLLSYGGAAFHMGGCSDAASNDYAVMLADDQRDWVNAGHGTGTNIAAQMGYRTQSNDTISNFARAFIGTGSQGTTQINLHCNSTNARDRFVLDYDKLCDLSPSDASLRDSGVVKTLQLLYQWHSPSAWDTVMANVKYFESFSRTLAYMDKALYSLYDKDKVGAFANRIRALPEMYIALSLSELMYTIRRGRFSPNVAAGAGQELEFSDGAGNNIGKLTNGVLNAFFSYFDMGSNGRVIIAPWWLANKLNHVLYEDTERDEEIRSPERADMIDAVHLLFEAMEMERGLHLSSESNIPLAVFKEYKSGELPDYGEFTDSKAALSASLLGYQSPRDAYYKTVTYDNTGNPQRQVGRIPYFPTLMSSSGTIIGKELQEFKDRIEDMSNETFITPASEHFKKGMQLANGIDYTTMSTRTRFGDHSSRVKVHMFGFFRASAGTHSCVRVMKSTGTSLGAAKHMNVRWFPIYGWNQFYEGMSANGLLPTAASGCYHLTRSDGDPIAISGMVNAVAPDVRSLSVSQMEDLTTLWPANYWRPGADNATLLLFKSTDAMFKAWMDRGDQVRQEGATFPTLSTMNLVTEMTYTTPLALLQRNLPYLRAMTTFSGTARVLTSGMQSLDFMTMGDNLYSHSSVMDQFAIQGGPLALRDRQLFSTSQHTRLDGLQLASIVVPLSNMPENWVSIFQARDWLYANTSLLAEPIMDSYSIGYGAGSTHGPQSAFANARLTVYQGPKTFEGRVLDVYCTPILGVGTLYTASSGDSASAPLLTQHAGVDFGATTKITLYPGSVTSDADLLRYNYLMFRLGASPIQSGNVLLGRIGSGETVFKYAALTVDGEPRYGVNFANMTPTDFDVVGRNIPSSVLEDDVTPGLYWDKLPWVGSEPVDGSGVILPYHAWFRTALENEASGTAGINYLQGIAVNGLPSTAFPGLQLGTAAVGKDEWRMLHIRFIENMRTNLEFQRAGLNFTIIDLDITDETESFLRQSLVNIGFTTTGPLTFVGTVGPEGQQIAAETITGDTVFEIVSLTDGAGALDESPSQADDMALGEDNPSMHIVDAKDV